MNYRLPLRIPISETGTQGVSKTCFMQNTCRRILEAERGAPQEQNKTPGR